VRVEDITLDIDANLSAALAKRSVLGRHETIQCACAAILSGFFETFLRDIAEAFIAEVEKLRIPYTALPVQIQNTHYEKGGIVLTAKQKNKGKYAWVTAGPDDIARRLGSFTSVPYELVWEAFADTQANPGVDVVRDMLSSFGILRPFAKVAAQTTFSEATLKLNLESFLAVRNECAHTGTATTIPTPGDLRDHCAFFKVFSQGIVEVLVKHLASPAFNRALAVPLPVPTAAPSLTAARAVVVAGPVAASRRLTAWLNRLFEALRRLFGG
jgi:hypothetical protein